MRVGRQLCGVESSSGLAASEILLHGMVDLGRYVLDLVDIGLLVWHNRLKQGL